MNSYLSTRELLQLQTLPPAPQPSRRSQRLITALLAVCVVLLVLVFLMVRAREQQAAAAIAAASQTMASLAHERDELKGSIEQWRAAYESLNRSSTDGWTQFRQCADERVSGVTNAEAYWAKELYRLAAMKAGAPEEFSSAYYQVRCHIRDEMVEKIKKELGR